MKKYLLIILLYLSGCASQEIWTPTTLVDEAYLAIGCSVLIPRLELTLIAEGMISSSTLEANGSLDFLYKAAYVLLENSGYNREDIFQTMDRWEDEISLEMPMNILGMPLVNTCGRYTNRFQKLANKF